MWIIYLFVINKNDILINLYWLYICAICVTICIVYRLPTCNCKEVKENKNIVKVL